MADDALTSLRLMLLRNGYTPLPVVGPNARGKSPGKRPGIDGWQAIDVDEATIRSWRLRSVWSCINTGLRCGVLRGVDIDILDADLAQSIHQVALSLLGPTQLLRIGRAPKVLLCYRAEPRPKAETAVHVMPDDSKAQVEILGQGQQLVAYGIHPDTHAEYTWPKASPDIVRLADLPELAEEAEAAFLATAAAMIVKAGGKIPPKEKPKAKAKATAAASGDGSERPDFGGNFFRNVNSEALRQLDRWVQRLFPTAYWQANATTPPGAWRVSSVDLGRSLEEDISIHPVEGAQDFGTRTSKSPIDLVMDHGGAPDAKAAAFLLCEWMGVAPDNLGWTAPSRSGSADRGAKRAATAELEDWPEPIDFFAVNELTGSPQLRADHVPECLYGFIFDTAARMGVEPAAVALGALVSCASVVTDDWRLQPKRFDSEWTEQPRIWGAIVGEPSIRKSPVLSACTRPVDALEAEARKIHQVAMIRYTAALNGWKKDKVGDEPKMPVLDRFMVESLTTEALQEVLRDDFKATFRAPARKVLVRQDEMAEFFGNLDRYNAGGKGGGDRGAFLRLYNGGRFTVDRVQRGSFATPNWSACFLGGIQPGPIQRIAKQAEDDGLLQRFMYCVPARQEAGLDQAADRAALDRYSALFPALVALLPDRGTTGIVPVKFHADAHAAREAIDRLIIAMSGMPDTSGRLRAAYGKFSALFARLCLIFHLIEIADLRARAQQTPPLFIVTKATADMVARYLRDIVLPHLLRADALMYLSATATHARWIAGYILAHGSARIARRDVVRAYGALRAQETKRELMDVMEGLSTIGWLRPEPLRGDDREASAWAVNPAVHTVFAVRAEQEKTARAEARARMAAAVQQWNQERQPAD